MTVKTKIKGFFSVQSFVFSIFVLSFYCGIKLVYMANQAEVENQTGIRDLLSSGYSNDLARVTDVSSISIGDKTTLCPSKYLDLVADYVTAAGCRSGQDCERLTCRALLTGNDRAVYNIARNFMTDHSKVVPGDNVLIKDTQNCTDFKRSRGYHLDILSESADLPIAFSLLVHTGSEQVERLLRSIYRPQNIYCIHVDGKALTSVRTAMESLAQCFDNVFISSRTERVIYAGISRLQVSVSSVSSITDLVATFYTQFFLSFINTQIF